MTAELGTESSSAAAEPSLEARLEISRRAVEQLEEERTRLEELLLRLPTLLAELDPDRLAEGITEAARELAGARFGLYLSAASERTTLTFTGCSRDDFAEPPAVGRAPVLAAGLASDRALYIDDVSARPPGSGARGAQEGTDGARAYGVLADGRLVRSWLAVPVHARDGERLGTVFLGHHRAHAFTARQQELVEGLCSQLGVALEHAALFEERTRVAVALQKTLLPPLLPEIAGVDLAARYRATGAGNLVGGDFYDVFEAEAGNWAVALGDVSGYGPEAAALTGIARYTLRALTAMADRPSDVLAALNEAMLRQDASDRFLTAVFACLAPQPGRVDVTLASGGHPPALVLRDDESVEVLDRWPGMLLGVFPDVDLADHRLSLSTGDALVLYTDGVVEARNDTGDEYGLERLEALLSTCAGRSAAGIARRIERAVLDHQGERAEDDLAVMVIRSAGP